MHTLKDPICRFNESFVGKVLGSGQMSVDGHCLWPLLFICVLLSLLLSSGDVAFMGHQPHSWSVLPVGDMQKNGALP